MLAEGNCRPTAPIFCGYEGGLLYKGNVLNRSFRPIICRANNILKAEATKNGSEPTLLARIRFHDLRHTCATLLLLAGENPKVVSERLGHKSIELTLNTYSHVLPTMQEQAAEKMNRILGLGASRFAAS
jgi:integrase